MIELYKGQPYQEVIGKDGLVLVQYFATWCNPCKMLGPVLEAASNNLNDVAFTKIDIDQFRDLAIQAGIRGVPTLILYRGGKEVSRQSGYQQQAQIESWISGFKA